MLRKVLGLVVVLAALLLSGRAEAQNDAIRYYPPTVTVTAGGSSFFAGGISLGNTSAAPYANLFGDAANTLAQRNGTNAQAFRIYGIYTDLSNYERIEMGHDGTFAYVDSQAAGTGTVGALQLRIGGGLAVSLATTYHRPPSDDSQALGNSNLQYQVAYVSRSIQGSKTKALTESSATTVATVAVPQTAGANFAGGQVLYTVYASDGTDTQVLNGSAFFSALNKAGTETCTITDDQIASEAASTGTLTCTLACAVGLADVVGITFDCASSLAQTTLNALVRFDMQQPNTLTFP